jgi:hypothetical protein
LDCQDSQIFLLPSQEKRWIENPLPEGVASSQGRPRCDPKKQARWLPSEPAYAKTKSAFKPDVLAQQAEADLHFKLCS